MFRSTYTPLIMRNFGQPAAAEPAGRFTREGLYQFSLGALVVLGVTYNALTAMLGAAGFGINGSHIVLIELALLGTATMLILRRSFTPDDMPSLLLAYAFLAITIYLSIVNQVFFPDTMRNVAIIALFTMLGLRATFTTLNRTCLTATFAVLAVLILESINVRAYVAIFEPAQYFLKTRDLPIPYWDKSGLFSNALGFKDRFTFGITAHRTSSIFLEQVSNANYAAFLIILLLSLWGRLKIWHRAVYIGTLVLILVTTSTRTSLILALIGPLGYFIYPRLPRYLNILLAPLFITIAYIVGDPTVLHLEEDNFAGRLSLTASTLYRLELPAALGQRIDMAANFMDSGFTWVIYTATVFGLILLWTFISCYLPQRTLSQKRCGYAISLYVASSLLVAGTAVFSIKVASILWFLAGFMRGQKEEVAGRDAPAPAVDPDDDIPEAEIAEPQPERPNVIRLLRTQPRR